MKEEELLDVVERAERVGLSPYEWFSLTQTASYSEVRHSTGPSATGSHFASRRS